MLRSINAIPLAQVQHDDLLKMHTIWDVINFRTWVSNYFFDNLIVTTRNERFEPWMSCKHQEVLIS